MRYSKSFYERFAVVNVPAAKRVMEELVQLAQPQSAIDLGCGERSFLSVLPAFGVIDSLGVEGPWVGDEQLQIPVERALRRDLDEPFPWSGATISSFRSRWRSTSARSGPRRS